MKNKMVLAVVGLSMVSLLFAAFTPVSTVAAAYGEERGGPRRDPADLPVGDGVCDEEMDGPMWLDESEEWSFGSGALGEWMGGMADRAFGGRGANGMGAGYALTPLSEAEADGLIRAVEEEYMARALYESIIDTFGEVAPFVEIAASEAMHAETLVWQAEKYGLDVPAYDPASFDFPVFDTIEDAYQAGIDAETVDAALYDELMADVTHTDLVRVYTNLQSASLNHHLVTFQAYLDGTYAD
ncbi:MAG: DUF2202 domain-containing protein [Anaerolineaceae bacterium]|nr:DUF2202 domain-containing protein [Anaerolineaceae bacterium]